VLPDGTLHIVVVDSKSVDATQEIVARAQADLPGIGITLIQESRRSHLLARIRGAEYVTAPERRGRSAILANADVDTSFHPRWIWDVGRRLGDGAIDAVTYGGTFPAAFWEQVPTLARRYFEEVGTVFFPRDTVDRYGFDEDDALLTPQVFADLVRVPSDCCWALRKDAYLQAGGFQVERAPDGSEVVFEGRNLRFRLDATGARVAFSNETPFETSPRRLLHEAERFLAGTAYEDGLSHLRDPGEERHVAALEELAGSYDFDRLRRYAVKHYVVLPAVSRPSLVDGNERYFGTAADRVRAAGLGLPPGRTAADVHRVADDILTRHYAEILVALGDQTGANISH
jgi:glycosyltransferase involved in cell wall biosynthesis